MKKKILNKDVILHIALDIIHKEGVKNCTMRRIAEKSNVAVGTLYNYYASQTELLQASFLDSWTASFKSMEELLSETKDYSQRIKGCIHIAYTDRLKRSTLANILNQDLKFSKSDSKGVFTIIRGEMMKIFRLILTDANNDPTNQISLTPEVSIYIEKWLIAIIFNSLTTDIPLDDVEIDELIKRLIKPS